MLIWRLRQALNDPFRQSASEWRTYAALSKRFQAQREHASSNFALSPLTSIIRGVGLIVLPVGTILFGAPLLILLLFLVFWLSPVLVPLTNLIYGLAITFNVSGHIAREHQNRTYDLLGTLPPGIVGLHWTYAIGWMTDHRIYRDMALIMVVFGVISTVFGSAALFGRLGSETSTTAFWLISSASVITMIIFDQFGTQVTAALVSMIVPAYTANVGSARMGAVGAFIGIQISAYLVGVLTAFVIMPAVYRWTNTSDVIYAYTLPVFTLIAFVGFRELIIRLLWETLRTMLNATQAEIDALSRKRRKTP